MTTMLRLVTAGPATSALFGCGHDSTRPHGRLTMKDTIHIGLRSFTAGCLDEVKPGLYRGE